MNLGFLKICWKSWTEDIKSRHLVYAWPTTKTLTFFPQKSWQLWRKKKEQLKYTNLNLGITFLDVSFCRLFNLICEDLHHEQWSPQTRSKTAHFFSEFFVAHVALSYSLYCWYIFFPQNSGGNCKRADSKANWFKHVFPVFHRCIIVNRFEQMTSQICISGWASVRDSHGLYVGWIRHSQWPKFNVFCFFVYFFFDLFFFLKV